MILNYYNGLALHARHHIYSTNSGLKDDITYETTIAINHEIVCLVLA